MKRVTVLGIDLAKKVFQLHGVNEVGVAVLKRSLNRKELLTFVINMPACLIGMEACGGSSFWARKFRASGHTVKLIPPQFVKPFVKSNKNDAADAEAICEAVQRPNMRFVAIKEVAQQDLQCIHRIRSRIVANRVALGNQIRGFLGEYGYQVSRNIAELRKAIPEILENAEGELTMASRRWLRELQRELMEADDQVGKYDKQIKKVFREDDRCKRIGEIPGVGPITATAIIAAVGSPSDFKNGRQMSAWLGLVPKQHSSGGKNVLLGISKRGNPYIRTLLIHGARSALTIANRKKEENWLTNLYKRKGGNKTCVALANKNARVIWAMLKNNTEYRPRLAA